MRQLMAFVLQAQADEMHCPRRLPRDETSYPRSTVSITEPRLLKYITQMSFAKQLNLPVFGKVIVAAAPMAVRSEVSRSTVPKSINQGASGTLRKPSVSRRTSFVLKYPSGPESMPAS